METATITIEWMRSEDCLHQTIIFHPSFDATLVRLPMAPVTADAYCVGIVVSSLSDGRSIDSSTVSSTFDMDQLWKTVDTNGKSALKLLRTAKFESDLLKTNEDMAPERRKILQTFACWGGREEGGGTPLY